MPPLQGARVQSLVGELRSRMLRLLAKIIIINNNNNNAQSMLTNIYYLPQALF